jgi:hypothetical protein
VSALEFKSACKHLTEAPVDPIVKLVSKEIPAQAAMEVVPVVP